MPRTSIWERFEESVYYNTLWLSRGILVVSDNPESHELATEELIQISQGRSLQVFYPPIDLAESKKKRSLSESCSSNDLSSEEKNLRESFSVLYALQKFSGNRKSRVEVSQKIALVNTKKPEEIFSPLSIISESNLRSGFYVSPVLPDHPPLPDSITSPPFNGINLFVTAGCLFGTGLMAYDLKKAAFPAIQHKIKFTEGEKIIGLRVEAELLHPYEQAQFFYLENLAHFIDALSNDSNRKKLLYHLPGPDYLLCAIKLFLHNRMDRSVLPKFFNAVKDREKSHTDSIYSIFKNHGIEVRIESPFLNLFGDISKIESIDSILAVLEIPNEENQKNFLSPRKIERNIVQKITSLLTQNIFSTLHRVVWIDILATHKINTLEELFKIANALMIAIATKMDGEGAVCSVLPSNEKQIAIKYSKCAATLREDNRPYPEVLSLTVLEHLVAYSLNARGNAFYFTPREPELRKLNKLHLKETTSNLTFFLSNESQEPDKNVPGPASQKTQNHLEPSTS